MDGERKGREKNRDNAPNLGRCGVEIEPIHIFCATPQHLCDEAQGVHDFFCFLFIYFDRVLEESRKCFGLRNSSDHINARVLIYTHTPELN